MSPWATGWTGRSMGQANLLSTAPSQHPALGRGRGRGGQGKGDGGGEEEAQVIMAALYSQKQPSLANDTIDHTWACMQASPCCWCTPSIETVLFSWCARKMVMHIMFPAAMDHACRRVCFKLILQESLVRTVMQLLILMQVLPIIQ